MKVAVVQEPPVLHDLEASMAPALDSLARAAAGGAGRYGLAGCRAMVYKEPVPSREEPVHG